MKKLFFALVTAVALISFASCSDTTKGPNEIKAVEMFKEMGECLNLDAYKLDTLKIEDVLAEAHDTTKTKFTNLAEAFDVWFGTLGNDMEKVEKAVKEWDKKKAEIIIKAAESVLPKYKKSDAVPADETVTEETVTEETVTEETVTEETVTEETVTEETVTEETVTEETVTEEKQEVK